MILLLIAALAAGFGLGRIKNASKLAAVKAELSKYETSAVAEVIKIVVAVKSKL